jgi:hypothetical protein
MNKVDSDGVLDLCARIAVEHDQKKFLALVEELNCILSARSKESENAPKQNK